MEFSLYNTYKYRKNPGICDARILIALSQCNH